MYIVIYICIIYTYYSFIFFQFPSFPKGFPRLVLRPWPPRPSIAAPAASSARSPGPRPTAAGRGPPQRAPRPAPSAGAAEVHGKLGEILGNS